MGSWYAGIRVHAQNVHLYPSEPIVRLLFPNTTVSNYFGTQAEDVDSKWPHLPSGELVLFLGRFRVSHHSLHSKP